MHRCLINPEQWGPSHVTLDAQEAHHLYRVIRAQPGQVVGVFDGRGRTADAEVADQPNVLTLVAGSEVVHQRAAQVTLYLSLLKSVRWEWALEKATELGVASIVPLLAENCVARLDAKGVAAKLTRWMRIVEGAAKQCDNPWVPDIGAPLTVQQLAQTKDGWIAMGALAAPVGTLSSALRGHLATGAFACSRRLGLAIGPEGDFTASETQTLIQAGVVPVSLGPRVLRAETAAMFGLSVLAAGLDDANL